VVQLPVPAPYRSGHARATLGAELAVKHKYGGFVTPLGLAGPKRLRVLEISAGKRKINNALASFLTSVVIKVIDNNNNGVKSRILSKEG